MSRRVAAGRLQSKSLAIRLFRSLDIHIYILSKTYLARVVSQEGRAHGKQLAEVSNQDNSKQKVIIVFTLSVFDVAVPDYLTFDGLCDVFGLLLKPLVPMLEKRRNGSRVDSRLINANRVRKGD